jgi:ketosteroid isomerase-like protein
MKRHILTFGFFLMFLQPALTQQSSREDILKVMAMQEAAWNRGDIPAFMESYWHSDSLVFISTRGRNFGWTQTLEGYRKGYPDKATMGQLKFSVLKLDVLSKKSAFMIGQWHLTRAKGDIGGYFTLLWKKIGKRWVIVADHTS